MIILPQHRSLQKGNLQNINGQGGTLTNGVYRNITGSFSNVNLDNTEVICQNFNAILTSTGFSLNSRYTTIRPNTPGLVSKSYDQIPIFDVIGGYPGLSGTFGTGGGGSAGGGITAAGAGGRGGSGGNGAAGGNWNEQTNTLTIYGAGGSGGSGFFGAPGESAINGVAGKKSLNLLSTVNGITFTNNNIGIYSSIAYGKGTYVAVGTNNSTNYIITSNNGISWTPRTCPIINANLNSIVYANGLFVAVGSNIDNGYNKILYSRDGIAWNTIGSPANNSWQSITYGNGRFVAVSHNGTMRVMTSTNGINWNQTGISNNTGTSGWCSVTYGNNQFVAVAIDGTNRVMTSPDGLNWTLRNSVNNITMWTDVVYGNGIYVAGGENNINSTDETIMFSNDAVNWQSLGGNSKDKCRSLTYTNGVFLFIGETYFYYSTNAINWNNINISMTKNYYACIGFNGNFFALSADASGQGNVINFIPFFNAGEGAEGGSDINKLGNTWLSSTGLSINSFSSNIINGNGISVRFSSNGNKINYSTNNMSWISSNFGDPNTNTQANLTFGKINQTNYFYSTNGTKIFRSTNAINWETYTISGNNINNFQPRTLTIGKNILLVGGINASSPSNVIIRSIDGVNFTTTTNFLNKSVTALMYGNGVFVAFLQPNNTSDKDIVMVSTDGNYWLPKTLPVYATFNQKGLIYGNGVFIAIGLNANNESIIFRSTDGINWTSGSLNLNTNNNSWNLITYNLGTFVIANTTSVTSELERVAFSNDGITWTKKNIPTTMSQISSIGFLINETANYCLSLTSDNGTGIYSLRTTTSGGDGGAGGGGGGGGQSIFIRYRYPSYFQQDLDAFKGSAWHGNGGAGAIGFIGLNGGTSGSTGVIINNSYPATISRSGSGAVANGFNGTTGAIGGVGGTISMGGPFPMPSSAPFGDMGSIPDTATYGGGGVGGTNSVQASPATGINVGVTGATGGNGGNGTQYSAGGGGGGKGAPGQPGSLQLKGANGGNGGFGGNGGSGGKPGKSLFLYAHSFFNGNINTFGENGYSGSLGNNGESGETLTHPSGVIYSGANGGVGGRGGIGGDGASGLIMLIGRNGIYNNLIRNSSTSGNHGQQISNNGLISAGLGVNEGVWQNSFSVISKGENGNTGLPGDPGEGGYISNLEKYSDDSFLIIS